MRINLIRKILKPARMSKTTSVWLSFLGQKFVTPVKPWMHHMQLTLANGMESMGNRLQRFHLVRKKQVWVQLFQVGLLAYAGIEDSWDSHSENLKKTRILGLS